LGKIKAHGKIQLLKQKKKSIKKRGRGRQVAGTKHSQFRIKNSRSGFGFRKTIKTRIQESGRTSANPSKKE